MVNGCADETEQKPYENKNCFKKFFLIDTIIPYLTEDWNPVCYSSLTVQEYLGQNPSRSKALSTANAGKEILAELRQANEILARLLAEMNDLYFSFYCKHAPRNLTNPSDFSVPN